MLQIRIYVLYGWSRNVGTTILPMEIGKLMVSLQVAVFNASLFLCSVLAFLGILTRLAVCRNSIGSKTLLNCIPASESMQWMPGISVYTFD
ncbi:hypothetical protein AX15_005321 [Amanita polypyramis BW_CC]|nr:hypothetical protein AX15_005321 [Amanita polypyramis BW_CC]